MLVSWQNYFQVGVTLKFVHDGPLEIIKLFGQKFWNALHYLCEVELQH
jgi:hypothetical protein